MYILTSPNFSTFSGDHAAFLIRCESGIVFAEALADDVSLDAFRGVFNDFRAGVENKKLKKRNSREGVWQVLPLSFGWGSAPEVSQQGVLLCLAGESLRGSFSNKSLPMGVYKKSALGGGARFFGFFLKVRGDS